MIRLLQNVFLNILLLVISIKSHNLNKKVRIHTILSVYSDSKDIKREKEEKIYMTSSENIVKIQQDEN